MTRLNYAKLHNQRRTDHVPKPLRQAGFLAKYHTRCALCHLAIEPGDTIRMWSKPKVAHNDCVINQPP